MRSTLLVLASIGVIGTAFIAYSAFQSRSTHVLKKQASVEPPAPPQAKGPGWNKIMPGRGAWVSSYDDVTGALKNRFRSDDYQPQPSGKIVVINPVAEFYMAHNQMMRLIGKRGEVSMPESSSSKNSIGDFGGASPNRGRIEDVTIQLFNLLPGSTPDVPDETITTQNVQFDNATRLITTEAFADASGTMIARDQAPVHMRSDPDPLHPRPEPRGYDFDGRGLRLRWNDKDGRLDLLEVAHGERLVVKDTSSAGGSFGVEGRGAKATAALPAETPVAAPPIAALQAGAQKAPERFPSAATTRAGGAGRVPAEGSNAAARRAAPPPVPVPYIATFYDNVRVVQGNELLMTANRMDVDFISRQKQEAGTGAEAAFAGKSGGEAPAGGALPPRTASGGATHVAAVSPTKAASPTTRPASPPVIIYWTGKLVMMSAQPNRPKVAAGDAIVELSGDPVTVRRTPAGQQEGDDVRAARLIYHTADGRVKLINSKSTPQVVISKWIDGKIDPQSAITTSTLDFLTDAAGRKLAILTGPGHASMPMEAKQADAHGGKAPATANMETTWNQGAKVFFAGKGQNNLTVEHVELAGDVDLKHPQLAMHSQELSIYFSPPALPATQEASGREPVAGDMPPGAGLAATRPARAQEKPQQELKRVVAREGVHCVMAGQGGKSQTIDCNNLEMQTARSPEGKFFARQVDALGAVHAYDSQQDLRAGVVALTLRPAAVAGKKAAETRPPEVAATQPGAAPDQTETAAVELEKMVAHDNVLVTNKDGSLATGAELVVTTDSGQNHVQLTGAPTAMVVDPRKNTIVGPLITFEQGVAHVVGAGKMHLLQDAQDGGKPRPMDVLWTDQADMDGKGNRIDIVGGVSVTTIDPDGAVSVAGGDRVHIDLMDKPVPATAPATQPASRPARKPEMADSMQGGMKDKDVRTVTLIDSAQVVSTLAGPDGSVLRQFALYGPKIVYQIADSKALPARTLLIPAAGRMYVGDHRPSDKAKTNGNKTGDDDSSGRGDTAFQWSKRLVYSETQRQATLLGDVVVVHQPLGKQGDEDRVRITSDQVTAWFEPPKRETNPTSRPATNRTTQPATRPSDPGQSLQLKHLTADGHVVITRATGAALYADRVDFEPVTHWMTARGSEGNPARYVDPDPKRSMSAGEMQWNTETWDIRMSGSKILNPK